MNFACTEAATHRFDRRPVLLEVQNMLISFLATLDRKGGDQSFRSAVEDFSAAQTSYLLQLHNQGVTMLLDPEHAMTEIFKKWTRIHDIGRLSIILPAYTLMDALCVCLSGILLTAKYDKGEHYYDSSYWVIGTFGFLAFYLNCLVRSLDDPFDGPEDYQFKCYAYSTVLDFTPSDMWHYGTCIDFACLTVDWGSSLRKAVNSNRNEFKTQFLSSRFLQAPLQPLLDVPDEQHSNEIDFYRVATNPLGHHHFHGGP